MATLRILSPWMDNEKRFLRTFDSLSLRMDARSSRRTYRRMDQRVTDKKFDLKKLAKRKGIRKSSITCQPIETTSVLEQELLFIINRVIRFWATAINLQILPNYNEMFDAVMIVDAKKDRIKAILEEVKDGSDNLVIKIGIDLENFTDRVEKWHRRKFIAGVKTAMGVDLFPYLSAEDAGDLIDASLQRQTALIQGLSDDLQKKVQTTIWEGFIGQTSRNKIAKELVEDIDISKNRAKLIARDQTTKLAADINEMRQKEAGLDQYKWRHSGKVNYRPVHKQRDGKIFSWSNPPEGGHPGHEINCGCTAMAYINLED